MPPLLCFNSRWSEIHSNLCCLLNLCHNQPETILFLMHFKFANSIESRFLFYSCSVFIVLFKTLLFLVHLRLRFDSVVYFFMTTFENVNFLYTLRLSSSSFYRIFQFQRYEIPFVLNSNLINDFLLLFDSFFSYWFFRQPSSEGNCFACVRFLLCFPVIRIVYMPIRQTKAQQNRSKSIMHEIV